MTEKIIMNIAARDVRFFRAAQDVIKNYKITRSHAPGRDGKLKFSIKGGTRPYTVEVHPGWLAAPSCTCPDAAQGGKFQAGGYCKHIMAVLLSNRDLEYQLLDVFL